MIPEPLRPARAPAAILTLTALAVWVGPALPTSLEGLRVLGPYAVLALGAAFALRFNRGRALIILTSLLAAYAGYHYAQGRLVFAAAFVAAVWRAWPKHTPLDIGLAAPPVFGAFLSAAGAVVLVAFVQESHRLAFRDELTGLPGRRALEEQLRALGPHYTLAMVDVDHFKKFNDTHGHDIGDQVLKLVAARLAEVGGGGIAFRYGGEEFSVLFPGKGLQEALKFLEHSRASIERYKMAVRGEERPRQQEAGIRRRSDGVPMKLLSVTVSMGAAEPEVERQPPSQVLKAADEALYRAKKGGRNRVSA
ncbi:MAG: GGDEF domain-containing protein [Proteobacteria bacterium]|nr:GGDEF domain-containing protein [Pseudomonadota bacterium]